MCHIRLEKYIIQNHAVRALSFNKYSRKRFEKEKIVSSEERKCLAPFENSQKTCLEVSN